MKKLFLILPFLVTLSGLKAQEMKFHSGNWASLLEAAKKQGKPFFVDFYADWCGPCKLMSRTTFADEKVVDYAGQHFIAYKLNAEEGEGIRLASQYNIEGYPTVVFFDRNGKEINRVIGYQNAESFLRVLQRFSGQKLGSTEGRTMQRATPAQRASLSVLFAR